jgi:hypothetical protein
MDRRRKDMYVSQWSISVQQALPRDLVGTLSYVGSKGTHLLTTSYLNLIDPATGLRPYPAFGQVEYRGNTNNSSYEGLVASLQRSFIHGFLLSANYVYSHEIDQDAAGGGDSDFPENPSCLQCERTSGDFDVRHVLTANTVYELPFGRDREFLSRPGILQAAFGGWSVTAIATARSGLPVNVTEDRSTGRGIHNWINPAAFGLVSGSGYGDSPRNIARGPNLWQFDLGLARRIPLSENTHLQFRSEFFNVFNRAQYCQPLADLSASTFGEIINTVNTGPIGTGTPRQIQFMLRLAF